MVIMIWQESKHTVSAIRTDFPLSFTKSSQCVMTADTLAEK